jgi:septal ring factor EnvC (AmiA/AmiB activator)
MKMFLYLAVAMVAGFGAGWLARNLMAGRKEDELQRTLSETRSKLPQFESLMRSRDEQLKTTRQEVKDKDVRIGELHEEMGAQDKALRESDRQLKNARNRLAALEPDEEASDDSTRLSEVDMSGGRPLDYAGVDASGGSMDTLGGADDERVDEVKRLELEVERLRLQEQNLEAELIAARVDQSTPSVSAGSSAMEEVLRSEVHELESRLRQTAAEHERLTRALEQEKRKVVELERERELQNKSLQVLHQQLELARENTDRAANG